MDTIRNLDQHGFAKYNNAHPVLGARYREIVEALQDLTNADAETVFGAIDAQKLGSSFTLFVMASGEALFAAALTQWCV